MNCSYDLCLSCCKDIRKASIPSVDKEFETNESDKVTVPECVRLTDVQLNSFKRFSSWKADQDGSIQCPPKANGGCGSSILTLKRIFKMNWVAKLMKNVEEMVNGCKIYTSGESEETGGSGRLFQAANRENHSDDFLYYPSSEDLRSEGIKDFRMHWSRKKPVIIKEVCDDSAMTIWDPMAIWKGIKETAEEKTKDSNRILKAVDCTNWSEVCRLLLYTGIGLVSLYFFQISCAVLFNSILKNVIPLRILSDMMSLLNAG